MRVRDEFVLKYAFVRMNVNLLMHLVTLCIGECWLLSERLCYNGRRGRKSLSRGYLTSNTSIVRKTDTCRRARTCLTHAMTAALHTSSVTCTHSSVACGTGPSRSAIALVSQIRCIYNTSALLTAASAAIAHRLVTCGTTPFACACARKCVSVTNAAIRS